MNNAKKNKSIGTSFLNLINNFKNAKYLEVKQILKRKSVLNKKNHLFLEKFKQIQLRSDFIAYTEDSLIFHIELGDSQDVVSFDTNISKIITSIKFETEVIEIDPENNLYIIIIYDYSIGKIIKNSSKILEFLEKIDEIC